MCKIKYNRLSRKTFHNFFLDHYDLNCLLHNLRTNLMNLNETKKILNQEIKKELKKSKLKVLTNENDFLVKNLKKAG